MGDIVVLSLTAAFNPSLLAATTVMLLLPQPDKLMLGYWLGAVLTSVTLGLVIVFALQGTSAAHTAKKTVSPAIDLALAAISLLLALVLATGRDEPLEERRARRKEGKKPPKWRQRLEKGTPRTAFVLGVLLSTPGASYLAALDRLGKLHYSTVVTVLVVIGFALVQLILLEVPMLAFAIAPRRTPMAIERVKAWAGTHWRRYAAAGLGVVGVALAIIGIVQLV